MTAAASIQDPRERVHAGVLSVASTDTASVVDDQQNVSDTIDVTRSFATGPPYLYYLVYTEDGIIPSQQPVDPSNPHLGRISAYVITPPHTANSIKRCICKIEKITDHSSTKLFASASNATPIDNDEHVGILTRDGPGSTPGQPLALVQVEKEDVFVKRLKVKYALGPQSPGWLDCEQDEVLQIDGGIRLEMYEGNMWKVYQARNSAGEIGFVFAHNCELL